MPNVMNSFQALNINECILYHTGFNSSVNYTCYKHSATLYKFPFIIAFHNSLINFLSNKPNQLLIYFFKLLILILILHNNVFNIF